jgi:ResB-like family
MSAEAAPGSIVSTTKRPLSRVGLIAERQRRSPIWKLIHLLGSLRLALVLLATIAIAIATATFTEARFDAAVARAWIYKAPWFIAWLGVLCINLFAVTLTRWPWQRKHTGFIITHYGIILLLIGAVVGSKLGFEGNVTLRTDGQPQRKIVTDRSCIQVESPADSYLYLMPLDTRFMHPSTVSPKYLPVPGTPLRIGIDAVSEHLNPQPDLAPATGKAAGTGVLLDFSSGMMRQTLHVGLGTGEGSPGTYDFFGRAAVALASDTSLLPPHDPNDKKPWLDLIADGKGTSLEYRIGRGTSVTSSGSLHDGDFLPMGWADWRLHVLKIAGNTTLVTKPAPDESASEAGVPGFRAFLMNPSGEKSPPLWVASGEVVPLVVGKELVRIGYGLELRPIPFSIALTQFDVPRDEGTETPSDFRATVRFKNTKTGAEQDGLIRMNHPASYPGGLLANMTGFNYKFSQAEWNPRDLKETTLQVLYDPGWLLKWIGSLAICIGIATMFYIRPRES